MNAALQALPVTVEKKLLVQSLRAGQKVVSVEAKALAPQKSGALVNSIRVVTNRKAAKRGYARVDVKAGNAAAFYAHMVEGGTGSFYQGIAGVQKSNSIRKPYIIR
ncbi:MAG: HK97 gp10 family phage protein, partial [Plesiomonas shigelloides]